MDERDYKAMNSENNSLGNLSEIAVGFYLWMNENGFDHNIKQRVEGKFIEYYRTQLLKLNKSDVISSVCGSCLMYLTCNNKDRDKYRCKYYDDEP
jgi:hypothetical protein